ncbi:MAG: tetratricopeptide repeat protein [Candidatus Latescibacteria bacterium]|nr:tetratricopeptide repeat protein [Candidatus Latescibacterota bacterium]MBT4137799.1 tetratricopeptide repeat protein [Candidatus Latescibacterota bacterium]
MNTRYKITMLIYLLFAGLSLSTSSIADDSVERDYFKRAIKRNPNDLQAHLNYQKLVLKSDDSNALKDEYLTYLRNHPQNAHFIYLYGRLLNKDSQKSAYFYRAIQADSTLFHAQFDLGKLHYYAGEYNDAIVRYRIAARLKPQSAWVPNLLGLAHYHSGYPNQAIVVYQKAIQNDSTYADAYLNLGLAYYYTNQFDSAIQTYKTALQNAKWDNNQHVLHHNLGMVYRKQGNIKSAATAYHEALKHNPNYTEAHISLGNLAFYEKNYAQAIQSFRKALGTESENADLHLRLGLAYFNTQIYTKAIVHFQRTLHHDATNLQTYHYLGRAYYLNEQPNKAIEALEVFIEKEKSREKRPRVAEAKKLIFNIKKEHFTNILK